MKTTIGGDRLGSGNKLITTDKEFGYSTHDMSYIFRSTMASGTLVPFISELALPGDRFKIDLNTHILTHPTIGPLFGSYKVQLDVFSVPIRLYNGLLQNNKIDIGLKMDKIKLPTIRIKGQNLQIDDTIDKQQINTSSLLSYLGIRGLGKSINNQNDHIERTFNAIPYLAYWDIYKQYYANKQEEVGAVIHTELNVITIVEGNINTLNDEVILSLNTEREIELDIMTNVHIELNQGIHTNVLSRIELKWGLKWEKLTDLFRTITIQDNYIDATHYRGYPTNKKIGLYRILEPTEDVVPNIKFFPLKNIDEMRDNLLSESELGVAYEINENNIIPYKLPLENLIYNNKRIYSIMGNQEGLAIKTYQSDIFNNWLNTDWIDGENGINQITDVQIVDGKLSMDALNISKKIYEMLNRIAVSGGTYDDWMEAVYNNGKYKQINNPVYLGGLSKELVFQEVISQSSNQEEPLGTIAGRGVLTNKHKGGNIYVKIDEPSYIIGLVSLTPRIDYSQGNKWDMSIKTLDDLHKPDLDGIGYQELITDQMAYWDTNIDEMSGEVQYRSAGKQPSWINYMTNHNRIYGNFADIDNQMFMTLNRRYEPNEQGNIKDLTTYIDPKKFNYIFADTRLDAQNFWTQISIDMEVSRLMSAKQIPNI